MAAGGRGRRRAERSRLEATLRDLGILEPRDNESGSERPIRKGTSVAQTCLFASKLTGSLIAGAFVTFALWSSIHPRLSRQLPPKLQPLQTAASGESIVYRRPPVPSEHTRSGEAANQDEPGDFAHAVKPVRFTSSAEPDAPVSTTGLSDPSAPGGVTAGRSPLAAPMGKVSEIKSWRYQLQGVNPALIAKTSSDLVVIDFMRNDRPFRRAEVEEMQRKPDGSRRIVLSYMSIGEAESYRWYWPMRSSAWLGTENPKWRGNYAVRFWHDEWQKIIFEYVDRILAAGFDGVYLDKVDEYEEMGHKNEMVEFVARISARAKAARRDFLVVSQNGDQLIQNPKFRQAIDAFAREDLFYGEGGDGVRNSVTSIRDSIERLKMLTAEGKPVFVVEYPRTDDQAKIASREISEQGFVGLVTRRSLDALER